MELDLEKTLAILNLGTPAELIGRKVVFSFVPMDIGGFNEEKGALHTMGGSVTGFLVMRRDKAVYGELIRLSVSCSDDHEKYLRCEWVGDARWSWHGRNVEVQFL